MAMQKLRLTGCERFNFKGELYEKGKVYMVGEAKAAIMLRKEDDYGRPYFSPFVAQGKSKSQRVAEAAAAAAAQAAATAVEEEILVDRTGEEPVDPVNPAEVVVDEDAAVEVDMDDADLDDLDDPNPEEVLDDRDDGTAVEV